jgi:DNA-binding MarR family transcriptional regulator
MANLDHPLNCLTFNLQRAARAAMRGFELGAKASGMTVPQFTTMSLLAGFGGLSITQLAERLGTDRTTLTRNLGVMAKHGWITLEETDDQRLHVWKLTDIGRERVDQARPLWQAYQAELVQQIGEDDSNRLLATLKLF